MKRILHIILILVFLSLSCVGCAKANVNEDEVPPTTEGCRTCHETIRTVSGRCDG